MTDAKRYILTCFVSLIFVHGSYGGTVLSSRGTGAPFSFSNARSMGMGGIAIALTDPLSPSRTNPAGLHRIKTAHLSLHYFYEKNTYRDEQDESVSQYSNFDGFTFVLPFGSGIGAALGLAPLTRMDYNLTFQESLSGESYTKSVEGNGGVNTFTLSLFFTIKSNLALGLSGHYYFGKMEEKWQVSYDGTGFLSTSDLFSTTTHGYGFTAGIYYRPVASLSLGAICTPPVDVDTQTKTFYAFNLTQSEDHAGSLRLPLSWGVGTTYHINETALVGIDFFYQDWTRLTINDQEIQQTRKTYHIALGGEVTPSSDAFGSIIKRTAYRLGVAYQPYFSLDPDGNTIHEGWVTLGLGMPFYQNRARVDVALGIGKRGSLTSNGLSENLLRLTLAVSGGERWFVRH